MRGGGAGDGAIGRHDQVLAVPRPRAIARPADPGRAGALGRGRGRDDAGDRPGGGPAAADPAIRAAMRILSDGMSAGVVPASVSTLVKGVMRSMLLSKLRTATAGFCVLTLIGSGLLGVARVAAEDPKTTTDGTPAAESPRTSGRQPPAIMAKPPELGGEAWPMSLRDAIRIGLDNSEIVRVISSGAAVKPIGGFEPAAPAATPDPARTDAGVAPIVITRLNLDAAPWRFKSEMMAHVRSVEQQYWNLNVAYVQLWAAREAVGLAREAVKRRQDEKDGRPRERRRVGRGQAAARATPPRPGDADLRRDHRRAAVAQPARTARRPITAGSSPSRRPPRPASSPTGTRAGRPCSRSSRISSQARELVNRGRRGGPAPPATLPAAGTVERTKQIERQKANLRQVIHQTTHSLARFFLEIDANYKQFQTASRVRAAAGERLDAQRAELRGGPDPGRAVLRRGRPVHGRRRHRGPVQGDLQHLDGRDGRGEGDAPRVRQDHRDRWPRGKEHSPGRPPGQRREARLSPAGALGSGPGLPRWPRRPAPRQA